MKGAHTFIDSELSDLKTKERSCCYFMARCGEQWGPAVLQGVHLRMSAHRVKWQYGKFQLDKRIFFPLTLFKHDQFFEGGCGYSKWAPEQPGFSPCWARGPPGLRSNPIYSMNSWKQSLGRICKHHILDTNISILYGQLLVYFHFYFITCIFYFVWECSEGVTLFPFLILFLLNDIFLTGWNWAPGRFQLLQVTLKSSAPCQTNWPNWTSLL